MQRLKRFHFLQDTGCSGSVAPQWWVALNPFPEEVVPCSEIGSTLCCCSVEEVATGLMPISHSSCGFHFHFF